MVQKSISLKQNWLPAYDKDEIKYELLKKNRNQVGCLQAVTKADIEKSENRIDDTFKKIIYEENQIESPIFFRPCKQTIEWRSTLTNFIRFEKSVKPRELL